MFNISLRSASWFVKKKQVFHILLVKVLAIIIRWGDMALSSGDGAHDVLLSDERASFYIAYKLTSVARWCSPEWCCLWCPVCLMRGPACTQPTHTHLDAGLMCPQPMCPWPKILGCCAPWTKQPLDIVPLTNVSRPWAASSMELAPSAAIAASVGLQHLAMDQWGIWPASPTPLTRFIGLAPLRRMHARPTHRTPPLRSTKACCSWKSGVASLNPIWI